MLCSWYPNRVQPANGNFVERHLRTLIGTHDITILQVEYDPKLLHQEIEVAERDTPHATTTVYFGYQGHRLRRLLFRMKLMNRYFLKLHRECRNFDLIHIHVAMPGVLLARYWKWWYHIPYVVTLHGSYLLRESPRRYSWWLRRLLALCTNGAVVACPVSIALGQAWNNNGLQCPTQIIPNVVNTTLYTPSTVRQRTQPPWRFLHISNFHPAIKNVEGILRVAKRMQSTGFPFELTIAGDGDLQRIKNYANRLELSATSVQLLGPQTEEQVAMLMQQHDCYVLFSNYETQGVTVLEAFCAGMDVVATDLPPIREVFSHVKGGQIVPLKDEETLLQILINYRPSPPTRLRMIATNAQKNYGYASIREQLLNVYQSALSK